MTIFTNLSDMHRLIFYSMLFVPAYLVIESDSFGTIKIHSMQEPIYYLCIGKDGKPVGIPKVRQKVRVFCGEK